MQLVHNIQWPTNWYILFPNSLKLIYDELSRQMLFRDNLPIFNLKILIIAWIILSVLLPISVNAQTGSNDAFLTYEDSVGGFKIQYPPGWKPMPVAISTVEIHAPQETFFDLYDNNAIVKITAS